MLSGSACGNYVMSKMAAAGFKKHGGEGPDVEDFVKAICNGLIEYLVANNQVNTSVNVVGGVDPTTHVGAMTGAGIGKMS